MRAVPNLVNVLAPAHEHEFEAARGLPEALPDGEVQLWQGSPDARLLARQALHLDLVAGYFALLLAWRGYVSWAEGATLGQTLMQLAGMLPLIALACGLLATIAWLMARTTVYTLTNRRIVMRVGIVLSITFNLPFSQIAAASWRPRGRGGDLRARAAAHHVREPAVRPDGDEGAHGGRRDHRLGAAPPSAPAALAPGAGDARRDGAPDGSHGPALGALIALSRGRRAPGGP